MGADREFEEILAHTSFVRSIARDLVSDPAAAEDVVQETMLAAIRQRPEGRGLRGWLATVARRSALLWHRKESRLRDRALRGAKERSTPDTSDAVARLEVQRRVVEAVLALEEPYRAAVLERYLNERSERETARVLGVPVETVRTRLRRARDVLRVRLDAETDGGRAGWCLALAPLLRRRGIASIAAGGLVMSAKLKWAAALLLLVLFALGVGNWGEAKQRADAPVRTATSRSIPAAIVEPLAPDAWPGIDRDLDLHGLVVDAAGAPIAGADVTVVRAPWRRTNTLSRVGEERRGPTTQTDGAGRFRLRLRLGERVDLVARADGFAPLRRAGFQPGERVRLVLREGVELTLRLSHRDVPSHVFSGSRGDGPRVSVHARTGADGCAIFRDLPPGLRVYVDANDPRFGRIWRDPIDLPDSGSVEAPLEFPRRDAVRGVVVDAETRKPIAGARVGIGLFFDSATTTDAEGRFELRGSLSFEAGLEISAESARYCRSTRTARPGETLTLELARGYALVGRLVGPDGAAVAGAQVFDVAAHRGVSCGYAGTDDDGRFRIEGLDSSQLHSLIVTAEGFGRTVLEYEPAAEECDLGTIELSAGRLLRGVVVDADGVPVPRMRVELIGANGDRARLLGRPIQEQPPYGTREERRTDDLGRFSFADLSPGAYELVAGEVQCELARAGLELEEDRGGVVLRLPRLREFVAVVRSVYGTPVCEASVSLSHEGGTAQAQTDAEGIARFSVCGRVRHVQPFLFSSRRRFDPSVYLPAEARRDLPADAERVEFELEIGAEVAGVVVDGQGKVVAGAVVEVLRDDAWLTGTVTGDDGRFALVVPSGARVEVRVVGKQVPRASRRGTLRVTAPTIFGSRSVVASGRTEVRIVVGAERDGEPVFMRVVAPDGTPIEGARVSARSPRAESIGPVSTDASGTARLTLAPRVHYAIDVRLPSGAPWVAPPRMEWAGGAGEVVLRARAGVRVEGVVEGEGGRGVAGAQLLLTVDGQTVSTAKSADAGRFSILVPERARAMLVAVFVDSDGVRWAGVVEHVGPGSAPTIRLAHASR